jgi:uncharacterized RDD family membrane protein YckC
MIDFPPGALWRRLLARLLDAIVGALVWILISMWVVILAWGSRTAPLELREVALLALMLLGLGATLHVLYHVAFIGGCGQTPGKMALGIAIVRRDGAQAGYTRALIRCLAGALTMAALGLPSVGVFLTRERRGLADVAAGTRVIRV